MYTIVMRDDKSLRTTQKTTLYQREKLVDKIEFLFPSTYNELDLSDFTITLKYVDQGNVAHMEILTKDEELYKDYYIRCTLPVDTNLTQFSGDITIRLTLSKVDLEVRTQYVLHTNETTITILPLSDYYAFVTDETLEYIDQVVASLDTKIEALNKISEVYDSEKADNITYEDNKIQLTANGQKIGDYITIAEGTGEPVDLDELELVEF